MSETGKVIFEVLGLAVLSGAGITLGMMVVCRLLKWSPVNITINNYQNGEEP